MPAHQLEARRTPLASAGVFHFVSEYKRRMTGFPLWKRPIFWLLMKANRWACAKLELPTIIHYNEKDRFWIEYRGGFTERELAETTVERLRREHPNSQFEVTFDLPLNGLLPEPTARYVDQDFPGDYLREFYKANKGPVLCPFKRSLCTPKDVVSREQLQPLFDGCAGVETAIQAVSQ
jgi:hypothetical protein